MRVAVGVGAVVSLGSFAWMGASGAVSLSLIEAVVGLAILGGISMSPFVAAGGFRLGPRVFLLAVAVAAALNVLGYVLAQDDSSSTSGVAAVVMPFYATMAVLILVGIDGAVRGLRRRRGG